MYNACWAPGEYDGVQWKCAWEIDNAETPDVRVSVRTADSVLQNDAPVQIFWVLDDRPEGELAIKHNQTRDIKMISRILYYSFQQV